MSPPPFLPAHLQAPGTTLSPATSEMNMYTYNSRSSSPTPTLSAPRTRLSAYDTLVKRRVEVSTAVCLLPLSLSSTKHSSPPISISVFVLQVAPSNHYSLRSNTVGGPNKKNYIEELTKQMDVCQKVGLVLG